MMVQQQFLLLKRSRKNSKLFYRQINFNQKNTIIEHQKILKFLNETSNSKFVTRKWNIVNDNSKENYDAGSEIMCNIKVTISNICDYNDAYIF